MSTPREVIKSLALDFKRRELGYADVAGLTGYRAQTIANIISSQKKYLCENQALRFSNAFGYDKKYLMTGEGDLLHKEESGERQDVAFSEDTKKLSVVMGMLSRYVYIADDPVLLALYDNISKFINEKDRRNAFLYLKEQERIFDRIASGSGK